MKEYIMAEDKKTEEEVKIGLDQIVKTVGCMAFRKKGNIKVIFQTGEKVELTEYGAYTLINQISLALMSGGDK
jgi:hypothetical protein